MCLRECITHIYIYNLIHLCVYVFVCNVYVCLCVQVCHHNRAISGPLISARPQSHCSGPSRLIPARTLCTTSSTGMTHTPIRIITSELHTYVYEYTYLLGYQICITELYSCRRISSSESYTLDGLYPDTLYYIWLAARSQRGEGATTPPIPVRTKQYGKWLRIFDPKLSKRISAKQTETEIKLN